MRSESPLNYSQTFMHVHQKDTMGAQQILTKIYSTLDPKVEALKISSAIYIKTCCKKNVLQPVVAVLKGFFFYFF